MREEMSLEEMNEQLSVLVKEQKITEDAYWENIEMKDKSILADWAQEILDREEKIRELKQKIANQSTKEGKTAEIAEEKSLVDISKLTPLQWIRQRIDKIKLAFKRDVIDQAPGIPKNDLEKLREEKLNQYRKMLEDYRNSEKEENSLDDRLKNGAPSLEEQRKTAEKWNNKKDGSRGENKDLDAK